jgi:hypothetical protein
MRALWERLNQQRWKKSNKDEREYVLQAFQDVEMLDQSDDDEDEDDQDTKGMLQLSNCSINEVAPSSESYDEHEDYDTPNRTSRTDAKNSALAVGYKSDRSFVIRGDKIGVFKHTQDDGLGIES